MQPVESNYDKLVEMAYKAMEYSYSPYSNFQVGAALLADTGNVYTGCNIENAAFSPTNCAERTAFYKAVSEGERAFVAIAIVGENKEGEKQKDNYTYPCGVCRQVMLEFCNPDQFKIVLGTHQKEAKIFTLSELIPYGFDMNK